MKTKFHQLLILLMFFSCSDKEIEPAPESVKIPQTELISLDYNSDDNSIKIVWRPVEIEGFVSYKIYRLESAYNVFSNISVIPNLGELRKEIKYSNQFSFTDTNIPFNAYVNYVVVTVYENPFKQFKEEVVSINHLFYERPEIAFEILSVEKSENGMIALKWEKDENDSFSKYNIHRAETNYRPSEYRMDIFKNEFSISEITNQSETTYEDSSSFLSEYITYGVSKEVNGKIIESKNTVTIKNPRFIGFIPIEMMTNPLHENEVIIISDKGDILFYNPSTQSQIHFISINKRIHHPVIQKYNGVDQLYIPSEGGKIFVYNLDDYSLIEEIDVETDLDIISIITKEDYIIFLESAIHNHYSNLSSYNRTNSKTVRQSGIITKSTKLFNSKDQFFFRLHPAYTGHEFQSSIQKYDIIDDELVISSGGNGSGTIKSGIAFGLSSDYSYFISSEYGYHLKLNYHDLSEEILGNYGYPMSFDGKNYIGIQEKYSDIHITENNNIYFSIKQLNRIVMYQYLDFRNVLKEFETQGKPLLFTLLNDKIIVINEGQSGGKSFIEMISN